MQQSYLKESDKKLSKNYRLIQTKSTPIFKVEFENVEMTIKTQDSVSDIKTINKSKLESENIKIDSANKSLQKINDSVSQSDESILNNKFLKGNDLNFILSSNQKQQQTKYTEILVRNQLWKNVDSEDFKKQEKKNRENEEIAIKNDQMSRSPLTDKRIEAIKSRNDKLLSNFDDKILSKSIQNETNQSNDSCKLNQKNKGPSESARTKEIKRIWDSVSKFSISETPTKRQNDWECFHLSFNS